MATYFTLTERRNACPACHAMNVLIGSDIIDGMEVRCSRCGSFIGRWSEAHGQHTKMNEETDRRHPGATHRIDLHS